MHVDKPHDWHLERIAALAAVDRGLPVATPYRVVDLDDPAQVAAATQWWEALTGAGGEGMVVKPLDFVGRGKKGIIQPAIKCRGPEHFRIIYGPDYTMPAHLDRLRERGLGAKRGLAIDEFALGVEGLERFVAKEPLRQSQVIGSFMSRSLFPFNGDRVEIVVAGVSYVLKSDDAIQFVADVSQS